LTKKIDCWRAKETIEIYMFQGFGLFSVECGTILLLNNDNIEGSLLKGILGLGLEAPLDNRISNYLTLIKCAEAQL
jgi:hypothetical protein